MDWGKVENYLNTMIAECVSLGRSGSFGLHYHLLLLKSRLDSGERSEELYKEIMKSC